jgi:hypothetical protein
MSNQEDDIQQKLKNEKDFFINNEVSQEEYSSDEEPLKNDLITIIPSTSKSKTDTVILRQLFNQQNLLLKSQRAIYKLKNEINKEEIKMRYLKLDLNNSNIINQEKESEIDNLNLQVFISKSENHMFRALSLLYSMYIIVSYFL